jgi:cation transport regulator ChaC
LNPWIEPILGLAEIGLLLVAVYLTIAQFTRSRASSYIERFNSSDTMESRVAVDRWLKGHATTKARLEALDEDAALRTHLRRFANLFQELGAAYQFGVAHRKTVRVLFDALVVMYWEQLRFWVHDYRAQADPTLYARFEYLYREIKSREPRVPDRTDYVVAYGSLMDAASLSAGLGRTASDGELIPISLKGWARRWSIGELVRLGSDPSPTDTRPTIAAFLDVEPDAAATTVAVMVRVSGREMKRLAAREKNYAALDVTAAVRLMGDRAVGPRASVWCFVGKDEHRVDRKDAVILQSYLDRVAEAALRIDLSVEADVRGSAADAGLDFAQGPYEFIDPDQAALV